MFKTITPVNVHALTCLRCCNIYYHRASQGRTQIWNSVLALDCKSVVRIRLEVSDQHAGWREPELSRDKMDAAAARCALFAFAGALSAMEAVGNVPSASCVAGRRPLQGHAGLIHRGDRVLWSRWRTWWKRMVDVCFCTWKNFIQFVIGKRRKLNLVFSSPYYPWCLLLSYFLMHPFWTLSITKKCLKTKF